MGHPVAQLIDTIDKTHQLFCSVLQMGKGPVKCVVPEKLTPGVFVR